MTLKELKTKILNKNLEDSLFIFKYEDNKWLINQYIKEIAKIKKRDLVYISSLDEISQFENSLYVIELNEVNFVPSYRNLIVISKKVDSNINYIEFPKLEGWQIQDYISSSLEGLSQEDLDSLFKLTQNNIYLTEKEIDKIRIFSPSQRSLIFHLLKKENNFNESNTYAVFELANYIIKRDLNNASRVLEKNNIDSLALVSALISQFKNIIKVQLNPHKEAKDLGLEYKQYKSIQYNINKYSNSKLINNYNFLINIDYRLKKGLLDISNVDLLNYILSSIL